MTYRQPFSGDFPISQMFGEKNTNPKGHTGIDYACPAWTPILASADGQVFFSGWKDGGYGYCVFIVHPDGNTTIYEHMISAITVSAGQKVVQGQQIGYSGSTGNSTGPHLHFEIRDKDGKAFDPMTVLTSVDDMHKTDMYKPVVKKLKNADEFEEGDLLRVVAPLGCKAYNKSFGEWTPYQQGTKFYFTGTTFEHNGYTYMQVIPVPTKPFWVAVHDKDCQILDNQ